MPTTRDWLEILDAEGENYGNIVAAIRDAAHESEDCWEPEVIRVSVKEDGTPRTYWTPSGALGTPDEIVVAEFNTLGGDNFLPDDFDAAEILVGFVEKLRKEVINART